MTDVLTPAQRRYCMSRIRGRNTRPEVSLRKALWRLGLRYRIKNRLPGTPDLVLRPMKTVLFVDGCFWHQCPQHSVIPKSNRDFWQQKLQRNTERDRRADRELQALGWTVVRIWEHEIEDELDRTASQLAQRLSSG